MVHRRQILYPCFSGEEERTEYLYLPCGYEQDDERRYPVLYMFDGHNLFFDTDATYGKSWGLMEYLDQTQAPLIVAAIECNHDSDNGRLKEYAPYSFEEEGYGLIDGYGEDTMQWIINEFKPDIDARCRTIPDRENTWIAGSSMGGLMSLYAVLRHNNVFSRAAALSPSLWANRAPMLSLIRRASIGDNTVIYMDYGSEELDNHFAMRRLFAQTTEALLKRELYLTARIVPGGTHCEASWERQLPFMLNTLFS